MMFRWFSFALSAFLFLAQAQPAGAVLAIDGTPVTGTSITTTLASAAFTNSNSNAVIIAVIAAGSGAGTTPAVTGVAGGCTWINRQTLSGTTVGYGFAAGGDGTLLSIWYCVSVTPFSAQVVTATLTNTNDANITIFAISGENTTTPWDVNVALPATQTSSAHALATPTVSTVSTTNANTMLLAFVGGYFGNAAANFPLTVPTGFTGVNSINTSPVFAGQQTAQDIVSSTQSSITVAYGSQYFDFYYIVDAIQAASAGASSPPLRALTGIGK